MTIKNTALASAVVVLSFVSAWSVRPSVRAAAPSRTASALATSQEIQDVYSTFSGLSLTERRRVYRSLSADAHAQLWRLHFTSYLTRHPELDADQVAVLREGLAMITTDFFAVQASDPTFTDKVDKPLRALLKKARWVFPGKVTREIFYLLGGPEPPLQVASAVKTLARRPVVRLTSLTARVKDLEDCGCSTQSDWCEFWYG